MTKRLTYTFDNGPWPGATDKVLEFLDRRGIKTTFFVVAQQLHDPEGRRLAEKAHERGHWIGNHTMTHGAPLGLEGGIERVRREIGEAQAMLGDLAHPRKFFRPNGKGSMGPHLLSPESVDFLVAGGFTLVTWTSAPGDWIAPHRPWLEKALADVEAADWTVLVLHDHCITHMMDTLERFQDEIEKRGVEIVQDFPSSCLIVEEGVVTGPLATVSPLADLEHMESGARR